MQSGRVYRQVPNFNLMPPGYQKSLIPQRRVLLRLLLGIVIVAEAVIIGNLYGEKSDIGVDTDVVRQRLAEITQNLAVVNAREEEAARLQAAIQELQQARRDLDNASELGKNQPDWPRVMTVLLLSQPPGLELSTISLAGTQIEASGTALTYAVLFEYHGILLASPLISQILSLTSEQGESSISFSLLATIKVEAR